jgi:Ca-activated chloride channel homolog
MCAVLPLALSVTGIRAAGFVIVSEPNGIVETWPEPRPLPPPPGPHPRPISPPFIPPPERHFAFAPLEVTSVRIQAQVKDQLATTVVDEEFYNPNPRPVEGTFLFPLPKGAQIEKFKMEIGGKAVEAELLDSDKARRLYEDVVRKLKDPALLEYAGREVLKARIFPIEPHSPKHVTLSYGQLLKADSGLIQYAVPLDAGKFSAKPVRSLSLKIELQTKRPLKTIYSPTHSVEIRRHGSTQATVGYETANASPDSEFQLFFAGEKDELGFSLLTHRTGSEDGYFLLLASPGFESGNSRVLPKDVAFVLDTSGSMAGAKLEQAKKALLFCVENLNDHDRFEVIRFSTETEPLFGRLLESSRDNRKQAAQFINRLKPIGGTAIDEALRQALALRPEASDRPYIIVFLTDGQPTVGTTDNDRIVANASARGGGQGQTRIFCFGIGTDVNTHLLDRITEATHAVSQYVLPEEDIEVKVSAFFSKIKEPVLANLKLKPGREIRLSRMYPSDLPDLFQGEQLVIAGRYSGAGECSLLLEGTAERERKQYTYPARFPESSDEHAFIPRLWATRRIGYLLDEIRLRGENSELRQEVTELARQYGIVTPYTAYLILEDETRRGVPLAAQSLPQLREDRLAQETARQFYSSVNRDKSGDVAVAGARYGLALKQTDNAQVLSATTRAMPSGLMGSATAPALPNAVTALPMAGRGAGAAERLVQYAQQSQFVNGRNFFLNGEQWVDAAVQSQTNAARVKIQFNSTEYFDLVRKHPDVAPWLALGQNVQFALEGKVVEITSRQ